MTISFLQRAQSPVDFQRRPALSFNRMVEQHEDGLDAVFHALADPTRRSMLRRLAEGEFTIGELAAPFRMSFAGASKHVKALERAGLIRRTVRGRTHVCRLSSETLAEAFEWMRFYERFWAERLDALERELRKAERQQKRRRKS
jgi:DNA-binding transcriptional ArsR family regulator